MNYSKYPILALWNFGYQCNMNCEHCYSRNEDKDGREAMPQKQAQVIAEKIIEAKVLHVHFGGGEPLMRRDFLSIARKLTRAGLTVSLSTNSAFLNEEMAGMLASVPVSTVGLSIYGISATTHDSFTHCPGSFDNLIKAVEYLGAAKVKSKFVFILCAKTAPEASSVIRLADKLGIGEVQFYPFKAAGNAVRQLSQLQLKPAEWKRVYEKVSVAAGNYPNIAVNLGIDNDPVIAGYLGKNSLPCPCGRYSVTIRPSGDVSACSLAIKIIGNIHQQSLLDIWQKSSELSAIREGEKSPCEFLS